VLLQRKGGFKVAEAETCGSKERFLNLYLEKPNGYNYIEGQYAFVNIPEISKWEWHPYSICTSPYSGRIGFMMKDNGNWSSKLLNWFERMPKNQTQDDVNEEIKEDEHKDNDESKDIMNSRIISEVYNDGVDLEKRKNIKADVVKVVPEFVYPTINLSYPISSPAAQSPLHKNVIYIGSGAGIATFM
jgi:hypothetical protein